MDPKIQIDRIIVKNMSVIDASMVNLSTVNYTKNRGIWKEVVIYYLRKESLIFCDK